LPPVLAVALAVGVFVASLDRGDPTTSSEPVAITAAGPRFIALDQLLDASDLVVAASAVAIDDGRAISDPSDPDAGIRTQLVRLDVIEVLAGTHNGPLLVEQEAELLDGTPVVVNGAPPLEIGATGVFFLVRGTTDEFPYTALVNEQGWVPVLAERITPHLPADPLWRAWEGRPVSELRSAVLDDV
jgi:hypothetical protein